MNTLPCVSVIVPVYNVEKYLPECVNSIINQTYKNLEIILVDDSSPDNCPKMCDDYACTDSRVKVIHKANGGLSDARNAGIEIATGDYICFIDSDDYITPDMIEQLVFSSSDGAVDIAVCDYTRDINELDIGITNKIELFSSEEAIKEILKDRKMNTSASTKIYKTSLFEGIRFPVGKIYEDYATVYKLFDAASQISNVRSKKYYYRPNPVSITGGKFYKKQLQYFEISEEVRLFVRNKYPKLEKYVKNRATRMAISFYRKASQTGFDDSEGLQQLIRIIRGNIFKYLFTGYALLSKAYGVFVSIFPKLALKLFRKKS